MEFIQTTPYLDISKKNYNDNTMCEKSKKNICNIWGYMSLKCLLRLCNFRLPELSKFADKNYI